MPKHVIWSPLSENDFKQILEYLNENWDYKVAVRFIDVTEQAINQISVNPKQYPLIYRKKRIRRCVLSRQNSLFYRERNDFIDILRIYDTRQDPKSLRFK
jgi:plasmid stabilization system protein ParE